MGLSRVIEFRVTEFRVLGTIIVRDISRVGLEQPELGISVDITIITLLITRWSFQ